MQDDDDRGELVEFTADIVSAYVTRNQIDPSAVPELIRVIHASLANLDAAAAPEPVAQAPAVPIGRSVQSDYIVCLEDGKKLKMLKRYLRARYDMTPDEYREKWGLAYDYPMVAPAYAKRRSEFAKKIGLGRAAKKPARR